VSGARIDRLVVPGVFSLDGQDFDVDNAAVDLRQATGAPIELKTVFTGDTLFCGGPGATGRSHSDEPTILGSIRSRLLTLPGDTVVRTGHGADTTIVAGVCHVG